jgi:very-long-chain ceramide synthase
MYIVLYCIVALTGLRVALMDFVFIPWAEYGGVISKKGRVRFVEQAWLGFYYGIIWTMGMVISKSVPLCRLEY